MRTATVIRQPATITVGPSTRLTLELLEKAAHPLDVRLERQVIERVTTCRRFVLDQLASGTNIYGATTGFGPLVAFPANSDQAVHCEEALVHLTAGQGDDLPPHIVRATLLTRLWSLGKGHSGISPEVLVALRDMLATDFAPAVPRVGSLGASGDLIPLAHAAQALRGVGYAYVGGKRKPASEALRRAGLRPLALDGRDGLALVNGTSVTAAVAGLALASARRSHTIALLLTAVLIDLLGSDPGFLSADLARAFGHRDTETVATRLRSLVHGMSPSGTRPLQEPYTIRCTPQLLGAAAMALRHAETVIEADLNGVSDNPVFFPESGKIVHGGNFFGQPVAFVSDHMANCLIQIGNLAERQLDLLIDPHRNGGLNPMLAVIPGEQHGVQGVQLAATATIAMMRRAAVPASVQSLPTNGHNQDVVPFGTQAALNTIDLTRSLRWLHGSLALALRQAVHLSPRKPTAPRTIAVVQRLIEALPPIDPDRPLDEDVRIAADQMDALARDQRFDTNGTPPTS